MKKRFLIVVVCALFFSSIIQATSCATKNTQYNFTYDQTSETNASTIRFRPFTSINEKSGVYTSAGEKVIDFTNNSITARLYSFKNEKVFHKCRFILILYSSSTGEEIERSAFTITFYVPETQEKEQNFASRFADFINENPWIIVFMAITGIGLIVYNKKNGDIVQRQFKPLKKEVVVSGIGQLENGCDVVDGEIVCNTNTQN